MMKEISIGTENIELGKFLKYGGAAQSGGQAKQWIEGGRVAVNGNIETRRHMKLMPGDVVTCAGREYKVIP
jgi:ribosome-associated protein